MTEIVMAEIITKDELTLISLPNIEDTQAIWNVFDKLCDNRTKIRIIYSKEGYGTKETVMVWPASLNLIRSSLDSKEDITSDICSGSDDFKLCSVPLFNVSNMFWCRTARPTKTPLVELVKIKKTNQSVLGLGIRIQKKRYMIGLLNR